MSYENYQCEFCTSTNCIYGLGPFEEEYGLYGKSLDPNFEYNRKRCNDMTDLYYDLNDCLLKCGLPNLSRPMNPDLKAATKSEISQGIIKTLNELVVQIRSEMGNEDSLLCELVVYDQNQTDDMTDDDILALLEDKFGTMTVCEHCISLDCEYADKEYPEHEETFKGTIEVGRVYLIAIEYVHGFQYVLGTATQFTNDIFEWIDSNGKSFIKAELAASRIVCEYQTTGICEGCTWHDICTCKRFASNDNVKIAVGCRVTTVDGKSGTVITVRPLAILYDGTEEPIVEQSDDCVNVVKYLDVKDQCFVNALMFKLSQIQTGNLSYADMSVWEQEKIARYLPDSTERREIELDKYSNYMEYIERVANPMRNIKTVGGSGYHDVPIDIFSAMDIKEKLNLVKYRYPYGIIDTLYEYKPGERLRVLYEEKEHPCTFLKYNDIEESKVSVEIVIDDIGIVNTDISVISDRPVEEY